ncbi:DUF6048 family protein [Psychroflexus aestuariivivens]|uniref:DUF6048 family protein n=1 Tax=Psychroflexus aestuariivivens TaxID=1795040 RepID=UPI000FD79B3E|nr:DUF6048 family protein [Psychroflexus aestuariivivens]
MNLKHTFIFFISAISLLNFSFAFGQNNEQEKDSVVYKERYGLTLGLDISRLGRTLWDDNYEGFEIWGDYRFNDDIYLAAELGYETYTYDEDNLINTTDGSYIKIGANYNVYDNWIGMQNLIYVGLRYGFASYSQNLQQYRIYTTDNYFEPDIRIVDREFNNLTASWIEMKAGLRVEVLRNIFIGVHVQLKSIVAESEITNFDNLYIPGFNRTYDRSSFGAGWGYSISYLIPIYTKRKTQAVGN